MNKDCSESKRLHKPLFINININEGVGIVRALVDSLYHLEKILRSMQLECLYEGSYEAIGKFANSKGEIISLEYTFQAASKDIAVSLLEAYKKVMIGKGLRAWMAYWALANAKGSTRYKCSWTDVMKWTASGTRKAYFSQKEKEEFLDVSMMLKMTKLTRNKMIKRHNKMESIQWIEQFLIGMEGDASVLAINVLMPKMGKKGFAPAFFALSTLCLGPSDIYLAFIIQARAAQMGYGEIELFFDWDYLFEIGGLAQTALSNIRMAKSKVRAKLEMLKMQNIIESWIERAIGMAIFPKSTKLKFRASVYAI